MTERVLPARGERLLLDGQLVTVEAATATDTGVDLIVRFQTGEIRDLTSVDENAGERTHRWPTAMPDGESVPAWIVASSTTRSWNTATRRAITSAAPITNQ